MQNYKKLLSPVLSIVLGVLLLVFKGSVVSIALSVLGVVFIVLGIIDITNKQTTVGIVRIAIGAVIIIFGWLLLSVALYVIAVLLVLAGVANLYNLVNAKKPFGLNYLQAILLLLIGLCLFFNQGATVGWVFLVVGIILVVQGVLGLVSALNK